MTEQDQTTETATSELIDEGASEAAAKPTKKRATRKKAAKKAAATTTRTRTRTRVIDKSVPGADEAATAKTDTFDAPEDEAKAPADAPAAASPEDDESAPAAQAESDDDADGDGDGSRRRRRGSRGGRGRSRSTSRSDKASDKADDDEAGDDEAGDGKDDDGATVAVKPKAAGGRMRKASSDTEDTADVPDREDSDGGDGDGGDDGGSELSKEDRATEEAIARGGTRLAAKRRGRSGSGGSGGSSGNRGSDRRGGPRGVSEETRRAILDGPPRTMLVTHSQDRTQIVVMEERRAVEHYVTHAGDVTYVGNIYMARVQNVLPGMEAAFLDIGKGRNGVLYAGEVLYDEQDLDEVVPRIEDTLKPGQKVLVQVTKDPMGTKGPRLTQHLSLAGRYCVLAPNSDLFGISRKLTDKERDRLRRVIKRVKPEHHGIIVRTAAENATDEALTADLERLLAKWEKVEEAAKNAKPMTAVYEEPKLVVKVIRDNFGPEFERCIVDDPALFAEVTDYLEQVAGELVDKVALYEPTTEGEHDKPETLFSAYNVSEQLRKAADRKVWLPSGGYLIIETTEAMKVVDVNTGKFTGSKDTSLEEIVLKTNLEAADEIVRQMRLRDMGGIIIIDFIDMLLKANQDQVIRRLKRELLRDRTKTRVSEVSRLGLVQMTRKNVSQGLIESFSTKCEHCNGVGRILELPE